MIEHLAIILTMQITMFMVVGLSRLVFKRAETHNKAVTEETAETYSRLF